MESPAVSTTPLALDERSALREMMTVAAPAVASMMSFALMQFVDRLLTSAMIGPDALTAVGNGGIASWVPGSVMFGVLGVINTYVSQNLGAGRPERGTAYAWAGIWLAAIMWVMVLVPYAIFFPAVQEGMRAAFGLEAVSEHIHIMETIYGRTLLLGMLLTMSARAAGHYFYGMHKPWIVMISTIGANVVNLVLAYLLILWSRQFGPMGSEIVARLGVQGTAIATVIGGGVECAIPLMIFLGPAYNRLYSTRSQWRFSWPHVRDILKIGWPGGVMFGNEMVCWWIFMGGYVATFDKGGPAIHGPAGWITHQYMMLSFMPAVGISIATTAMVGKCIGAGRHDLAQSRTWLGVKITLAYMGVCALCFIMFGEPMARLFTHGTTSTEQVEQIVHLARWMLILAATFQLFDGLAITLSGALRGAGDTVVPGILTIFLSWGVIVGGGWLVVNYAPGLSSYGPWMTSSLYIILLSLMLLTRFVSGHWKKIKILDRSAGETAQGGRPSLVGGTEAGGPGGVAMAPGLDVPLE